MKLPPMLMHVRIMKNDADFGVWLPLFLFILIAFIILLALSPLILICLLLMWPSGWGRWLVQAFKAGVASLWALKGLSVDIQNRDGVVKVTVI
jgi:hypothetical protein